LDNQSSQTSSGTEIQTPSLKGDILDTSIPTSKTSVSTPRAPGTINQELLNTDIKSPEYSKLLNELNLAISKPTQEPTLSQQKSPETTSPQPETQESQPSILQNLYTLVENIDPKYPGDLDIFKTNLNQQKLNPDILGPLLNPIQREASKTVTELNQAKAEINPNNTNKVTRLAESIISRLTSTGIQTPLAISSCKTIANIYHISRSADTKPITSQNPELDYSSKPNETVQDELNSLSKQIDTTQRDSTTLEQQLKETIASNEDLTKQITHSKEKVYKLKTDCSICMEQLPSSKKLAA